jgi:hypothetical protein
MFPLFGGFYLGQCRGIVKPHMNDFGFSWKHRTELMGMAANGNYNIPLFVYEIIDPLELMVSDVHACFGHGIEPVGFDARRPAMDDITFQVIRPPFGHLTTTWIAGA